MNIKTLLIRSASGLVYITLIIGAILLGGIYFKIIFGLLAILTVYEFHTLTNKQENINALPILGAICAAVAFAVVSYYKQPSWLYIGVFLMCFILMCLIICAVIEMFRKTPNPINNVAYTIFGQIYIVLPFSLMAYILSYNKKLLLAVFVIIWVNDTFAYLTGSLIGKHKLSPKISPNKSWEGLIGGLVGTWGAALLIYWLEAYAKNSYIPFTATQWLALGTAIMIFGTLGDLFESMIKRTVGVKDSGNIMPGHGGLLDRLDSVLFATLPAAVLIAIFRFVNNELI